ncbi:uncharacterized protein LY89DRAFT_585731 [Mollisia scopiformis]|uniref:F-box domain-containing protein n=1 Tax=Mollisia scopiformis TaxID=149040 RepID=A0A194XB21_MOLSC|nr:uncharacterized protein LY89DRAFT_585731 [Mollisia scopiformis]KUJ16947.1 hypothetical protein LY89DRAFT_585731 [Mollisia scopiformis]
MISTAEAIEKEKKISLMDLPTELHLQIASYLTYPDALSLKHTSRHFYGFVYTGVNLKVEWLIKRRILHLDCPHDRGCELGSDMRFCRGSVRLLMKRRREHGECETREGGRGCLVFETKVCTYRKERMGRFEVFREWMTSSKKRREVLWWILVTIMGIVLAGGLMLMRNWLGVGEII